MWWFPLLEWAGDVALGALAAGWVMSQPSPDGQKHGQEISIPADASHGCHAELTIIAGNGQNRTFSALLDSGATGHALVMGSNQAYGDLGIDPRALTFSHTYRSANGVGHYATIVLREVKLSSFRLENFPAEITQAPQDEMLIGAEILHRLSFTTAKGVCKLSLPVEARFSSVR